MGEGISSAIELDRGARSNLRVKRRARGRVVPQPYNSLRARMEYYFTAGRPPRNSDPDGPAEQAFFGNNRGFIILILMREARLIG